MREGSAFPAAKNLRTEGILFRDGRPRCYEVWNLSWSLPFFRWITIYEWLPFAKNNGNVTTHWCQMQLGYNRRFAILLKAQIMVS